MGKSLLTEKHLKDENAARAHLESIRWPNGPVCPHCSTTKIYRLKVKNTQREVLKCAACRKQFTVTVGTIFEDSHLPLTIWIQAMQLLCSSKKGMSTHQLHRMLGITYKSAWFMAHRIRHAMSSPVFTDKLGGTVEIEGVPIWVGGSRKEAARITIEEEGREFLCESTRELAIRIAPYLFTTPLRLMGRGRWQHDENGKWILLNFRISDFMPLKDAPLNDVVALLRAVEGTELPNIEDPWAELQKLRHGGNGDS